MAKHRSKQVLCYGDSNTWGFNPLTKDRFDSDTRWTGILSKQLGSQYEIIEEGSNGRTTIWDDPFQENKNGRAELNLCLDTYRPLDLVIIMLGTNDLKQYFHLSAQEIAQGAGILVGMVQDSQAGAHKQAPVVLLLAPPPTTTLTEYAEDFVEAGSKSQQFAEAYRHVAEEKGCAYFDTSTVIVSSELDGIHLEANEHRKLAQAIAAKVKELIG